MNTEAGKAAKKWLWDALQPLEAICVETIQLGTKAKRDKYGRFLAVIYDELPSVSSVVRSTVHPLSINAKMIAEGHAKERYW
jgi:endonuclease YncB( thermonuclease family)